MPYSAFGPAQRKERDLASRYDRMNVAVLLAQLLGRAACLSPAPYWAGTFWLPLPVRGAVEKSWF